MPRRALTTRIHEDEYQELQRLAAREGRTMNDVVAGAIRELLRRDAHGDRFELEYMRLRW